MKKNKLIVPLNWILLFSLPVILLTVNVDTTKTTAKISPKKLSTSIIFSSERIDEIKKEKLKIEEQKKEQEEQDLENNPIKRKFKEIKKECENIDCMIKILLTALDNDFNKPSIQEVSDYLLIIKKNLLRHYDLLDEFLEQLQLPNGKTKLISLSYKKFKD